MSSINGTAVEKKNGPKIEPPPEWLKKPLLVCFFVFTGLGVFKGFHWIKRDIRSSGYNKYITPIANVEIQNRPLKEKLDYAKYRDIHLAACHLHDQNRKIASDGDSAPSYSDGECEELMLYVRPQAKTLREQEHLDK
jgi:hypothetical protein